MSAVIGPVTAGPQDKTGEGKEMSAGLCCLLYAVLQNRDGEGRVDGPGRGRGGGRKKCQLVEGMSDRFRYSPCHASCREPPVDK